MNSDRLSGAIFILLGVAAVVAAYGFYVPYQYEPLGPKALPYVVGGLLIVCGAFLLLAPQPEPAESEQKLRVSTGWRQWLLVLVLLAYAIGYEQLGFVVASLVASTALARLAGAGWFWCGAVAVGLAAVGHLVLVEGLGLQLPAGLLQGWL